MAQNLVQTGWILWGLWACTHIAWIWADMVFPSNTKGRESD